MPRLSGRGTLPEIVVLNAVLATAAWRGRLPGLFYFTSGLTNLLLLTYMKSFRWWFSSPETLTLKSGRALLISLGMIWVLAGCIALVVFNFPIL
jgi:hypothetical protein